VEPTSVHKSGVTSVETGAQYTVASTLAAAEPPLLRRRTYMKLSCPASASKPSAGLFSVPLPSPNEACGSATVVCRRITSGLAEIAPVCGSPTSPSKSLRYTSGARFRMLPSMIARRLGITPMRSTPGFWEGVPFAGSLRMARNCQGPKRCNKLASARPCTASAAPVTMGEALEVPLKVDV